MTIQVICPSDRAVLREGQGYLSCQACNRRFMVKNGVVCMLDQTDAFYEGAYENAVRFLPRSEKPWRSWPLWLINSGYVWSVRRHVLAGSTVVEMGCAGGVQYFGTRYRMIGCDLSASSLTKAVGYERRLQADAAECIPLPDRSVDAVVSSYFWEHIAPAKKPRILAECRRILRPGGKVVFLYDVETENPLIGPFRRRDEKLYSKLFIEGDGHMGYQRPEENLALFQQAGLRLIWHAGLEKTWLSSPSVYSKLAQFEGPWRALFRLGAGLGSAPWFYPYTALTRTVDALVCPWLPESWARINAVVLESPASPGEGDPWTAS